MMLVFLLFGGLLVPDVVSQVVARQCELITVASCIKYLHPYNMTQMPNFLEHTTQMEAEQSLNQYMLNDLSSKWTKCSPNLEFFLCAVHLPFCIMTDHSPVKILPCRSMCEQVRDDCMPTIRAASMQWPKSLDCSKLSPTTGMCIKSRPQTVDSSYKPYHVTRTRSTPPTRTPPPDTCPDKYVANMAAKNVTCVPRCGAEVLYTSADKQHTEMLVVSVSAGCLCVALLVLVTALLDRSRFLYPERPVLFLALCYLLQCVGYVLRAGLGHRRVACGVMSWNGVDQRVLVSEGLYQPMCALLFLLVYYSETAAACWWLILSFVWLLAAGRKWSAEAVRAVSGYFHALAWALPAALSIAALALNYVSGDELTGTCVVRPGSATFGFVVAPRLVCLVVGASLILAGFVSMIRIRHDLRAEGTNLRRMETLMMKLAIFSLIYCTLVGINLSVYIYEVVHSSDWLRQAADDNCTDCRLQHSIPPLTLLQTRLAVSLLAGVCCIIWIWGTKTLHIWRNFCLSRWTRHKKDSRGRYQAPEDGKHVTKPLSLSANQLRGQTERNTQDAHV